MKFHQPTKVICEIINSYPLAKICIISLFSLKLLISFFQKFSQRYEISPTANFSVENNLTDFPVIAKIKGKLTQSNTQAKR